jgi:hypothetical protein
MDTSNFPTLFDRLKIDEGIGADIVAEAITQSLRPEMARVPAETITGDSMQLTVLKSLPTASFRHLNQGTSQGKPQ